MKIHDDADYTATFGPDLVDEVHAAIQPGGDCQACGSPLGSGPLRLGLHQVADSAAFLPRHGTCAPPPPLPDGMFVLTPTSYVYNAIGVPIEQEQQSRWRRWSTKRPPSMMPVLVINPCTDRVDVHRRAGRWEGPLDTYRDAGFVDFGRAGIGTQVVDKTFAKLQQTPAGVEVHLNGNDYPMDGGPDLKTMIANAGGLLVAVSVRARAGDITASTAAPLYDVAKANPADVQTAFISYR